MRDYDLQKGGFFRKPHEVLLEAGLAHGWGIDVGDEVTLATMRGGLGRR